MGVDDAPAPGHVPGDRADGGDEREGAPQVAGQAPGRDRQEQEGAGAGEEQRRRRVEAREQRDQEGRAEHGDDVLDADADGARPGQALVGGDDLARGDGPAVAVEAPAAKATFFFFSSMSSSVWERMTSNGYIQTRC